MDRDHIESELRVAILAKIGQLGYEIDGPTCRMAIDAAEKITKDLLVKGTMVQRKQHRLRKAS